MIDSCKGDDLFHCPRSRECVPSYYRCDHFRDCDEGEDEEGCGKYSNSRLLAAGVL
jgi:hypothetical protein